MIQVFFKNLSYTSKEFSPNVRYFTDGHQIEAACGMLIPISTGYALPEVSFPSKCRCHHKPQHGRICIELEIDSARGVTMTVPGSFGRASLLVLVCFGRMVLGLVLESERLLPSFYLLARRNAFDDSPKVVHHKTIEMTRHIKARHQGGNQQRLQIDTDSMYVQQTMKLERICRDALNPIPMAIFI